MSTIGRVSAYLFRFKALFYSTLLLAVLSTLAGIGIPWIIGEGIRLMETQTNASVLFKGCAVLFLIYVLKEIFNGLRIVINNLLEQRVLVVMRKEIHAKLLELPVSFYDKRKSGEISSRVVEDVANVERALLDGTEQGITALLTLFGVTIAMFLIEPRLAMMVFIPIPVLFTVALYYIKGSRKVWKKVREASADLNSLLVEDIQGNRLIQSFHLQERESRRFNEKANRLKTSTLKAMFRWAIYNPLTSMVFNLGMVIVLGYGGYLTLQVESDFGFPELAKFFFYVMMLTEPLRILHGVNHLLVAGKSSGDRVFEIIDQPVTIKNNPHPKEFPQKIDQITFHDVSFAYSERVPLLEEFSLEIAPGEVTALVGHTGAGKTTIAQLLLRIYDPNQGSIQINQMNLPEINLSSIRENIGFVAQDPFLFEGSVVDNLLLAKEDASYAECQEALEGAAAWDFVNRLPEGMNTNIGEKGIRLSQGEKQRLTIARVLLKNPPIVILDEATSSVDTATEKQIQQALGKLMENRTVLVIAHRLSTIAKANKIVVLEQGKILEIGTHNSLLEKNGKYAYFWSQQSLIV